MSVLVGPQSHLFDLFWRGGNLIVEVPSQIIALSSFSVIFSLLIGHFSSLDNQCGNLLALLATSAVTFDAIDDGSNTPPDGSRTPYAVETRHATGNVCTKPPFCRDLYRQRMALERPKNGGNLSEADTSAAATRVITSRGTGFSKWRPRTQTARWAQLAIASPTSVSMHPSPPLPVAALLSGDSSTEAIRGKYATCRPS